MALIDWFGGKVGELARKDPEQARRLLLVGYRADLAATKLALTMKGQTGSRRYAAVEVMKIMIHALTRPENAAMVSLFMPCEPLHVLGMTPYSLEAVSGYLMGTSCETFFQGIASEAGVPETLCSFHRSFLGAAQNGLMPAPKLILYTNTACDGNLITFPALKEMYQVPAFIIDVPWEKSEGAVEETARQLREMVRFLEDVTKKKVEEQALKDAVFRSQRAMENYHVFLSQVSGRRVPGDGTGEMYLAFMARILLGSEVSETYFTRLRTEIEEARKSDAKRILWVHVVPYMQPALREVFKPDSNVFITACDLGYDALLQKIDPEMPYESMARRLVYSGFNGGWEERADSAVQMAEKTGADGIVVFAHWGCKATLGVTGLMKKRFEEAGYPTLILDGDAGSPSNSGNGQMATRLGAYLEMLEAG